MQQDVLVKDMVRTMKLPTVKYDQPVAIIFVGAPATGKTTFAAKLTTKLPLACFSNEEVETYLTPHVNFFDNNELTLTFSFEVICELLKQKTSVIFDFSIDKIAQRKKLKEMVNSVGGQLMIVYFECEDEDILHRIQNSNIRIVEGDKKGFILDRDYYFFKKSKIQSPLGEGAFIVSSSDPLSEEKFTALLQSKLSHPEKFSS